MLCKPRPMQAFKQIFNCDASNVTGLADGLEHKKLLKRYENENDRRIKMLKLTAAGEKLRRLLGGQVLSPDNPIVAELTSEEQDNLFKLFEKVLRRDDV
jgi:DNA-binding MarR family transcriptional regulator